MVVVVVFVVVVVIIKVVVVVANMVDGVVVIVIVQYCFMLKVLRITCILTFFCLSSSHPISLLTDSWLLAVWTISFWLTNINWKKYSSYN